MRKQNTFFGFPRTSIEYITQDTIVIIGSQCVTKSIHPSLSQQKAVNYLRQVSHEYDTHNMHINIRLEDYDIVDLGDYNCGDLSSIISRLINIGARIVVIGGDHATTYYTLRDIKFDGLTIFDAHLDSEECGSIHHGCFLRKLIEEKKIHVEIVGFRGYSTLERELRFLSNIGISHILYWPTSPELVKYLLSNRKYVSIDLDFFSPNTFSAVRVPEVGGFHFDTFIGIINKLDKTEIRYVDITEYSPDVDKKLINGKRLIQLLLEILSLMARS